MTSIQLTEDQRDCLQEITNVAMGQAADLLARLLDVFVNLPIPKVAVTGVSEIHMALADLDSQGNSYSGVCQGFIGDGIAGEAMLIFTDASYSDLANLLNYSEDREVVEELELLMDVASILNGACLRGIAEQLELTFSLGHPVVLGQHSPIADLLKPGAMRWKEALTIELSYSLESHQVECDLLLLFTEDSMPRLLDKINILIE